MGELRPYQQAMLDAVRQAYRDGARRPCLVLPCGGGKSVIAAEMARLTTLRGKRVLYLVHRRERAGEYASAFRAAFVAVPARRLAAVCTIITSHRCITTPQSANVRRIWPHSSRRWTR